MTAPTKHEHLADMIQAEMKERDWTITDLIMNMGTHFSEAEWEICQLSWEMFFAVRDPNVLLGDVMAEQLEAAFDMSKQFFLNFHESWRTSTQALRCLMKGGIEQ